jgi:hypothetical protein
MAIFEVRFLEDDGETVVHTARAQVGAEAVPKFFDYQASSFGQVPTGDTGEDGQPIMRGMTEPELWASFARKLIGREIADIHNHEQAMAAQRVPVITFTPLVPGEPK